MMIQKNMKKGANADAAGGTESIYGSISKSVNFFTRIDPVINPIV